MGGVGDALTPRDRHVRPIRTHEKQAKMGKREENDEKGDEKDKREESERNQEGYIFNIERKLNCIIRIISAAPSFESSFFFSFWSFIL